MLKLFPGSWVLYTPVGKKYLVTGKYFCTASITVPDSFVGSVMKPVPYRAYAYPIEDNVGPFLLRSTFHRRDRRLMFPACPPTGGYIYLANNHG